MFTLISKTKLTADSLQEQQPRLPSESNSKSSLIRSRSSHDLLELSGERIKEKSENTTPEGLHDSFATKVLLWASREISSPLNDLAPIPRMTPSTHLLISLGIQVSRSSSAGNAKFENEVKLLFSLKTYSTFSHSVSLPSPLTQPRALISNPRCLQHTHANPRTLAFLDCLSSFSSFFEEVLFILC